MECSTCIYLIPLLIILSGLLVASENALSKFKAYYDENDLQAKNSLARLAMRISNNTRDFSDTFLISKLFVFILIGWLLSNLFHSRAVVAVWLNLENYSNYLMNDWVILISAYLVIIPFAVFISGVLPKYFSGSFLSYIAVRSAMPVYFLHYLLLPLRLILKMIENIFEFLFKKASNDSHLNSEEELRILIEESTKAGNIEENESILIDNIFEFKETVARQVMTPRKNIVAIGDDWNEKEVLETVISEGYSRYPVYSGNVDNIKGILHTKDLVNLLLNKKLIVLNDLIRPTSYVHENHFIDELLREFQKKKLQMAVVVDEFGGTSGIVTMEDVLEEIVGEIHDEHDEVNKILEKISDNIFIANADSHVRELNDLLPELLPESEDYESIGGLVITETESIPELNAEITIGNYTFVIIKRSKSRIERIKIIYHPKL